MIFIRFILLYIGIGRVPFTGQNLWPRMRRAFLKSSVAQMVIGFLSALLCLMLGAYLTYLIAARNTKSEYLGFLVNQHPKNSSFSRSPSFNEEKAPIRPVYIDGTFSHEEPNSQERNEQLLKMLLLFITFLTVFTLLLLFMCCCLLICQRRSTNSRRHNGQQRTVIPVIVYDSVATQTSIQ
jgi:flagellar biogenesis protein FliO